MLFRSLKSRRSFGLGSGFGGWWWVYGCGCGCGWDGSALVGVWDGKVWVWPVREGISATEAGEPGGMIVWRRIADILKKLIEQAR